MRKQGNITLTKERIKTPEKRPKQNGDKQSTRCRVQNTDYKETQGTNLGPQQHKKYPVRNKGHTN